MIELRLEEPGDSAAIREVHRLAFAGDSEARIVDALRDAHAHVLSMVAADADAGAASDEPTTGAGSTGGIVGHVLYTFVVVTDEDGTQASLLGLGPVGVLPQHQGLGIGTMLIAASLERLRTEGYPGVVVVGDSRYYSRFGFLAAGRFGLSWDPGIPDEVDVPDDVFLAVELAAGALAGVRGVVRFRPEFAEV